MNTFKKQPSETYTFGIDFAGKLPAGTTIQSGVITATDPAGLDASTVIADSSAAIVGDMARIKVLAGLHGQSYRIRLRVTLTNMDILEEDTVMLVENV
jgi:hypothetical protein